MNIRLAVGIGILVASAPFLMIAMQDDKICTLEEGQYLDSMFNFNLQCANAEGKILYALIGGIFIVAGLIVLRKR